MSLMTKLKLLQINVAANWGSHGRIAEEIGLEAMAQGWESYIAYGRYANPSKSHIVKIGDLFDQQTVPNNKFYLLEAVAAKAVQNVRFAIGDYQGSLKRSFYGDIAEVLAYKGTLTDGFLSMVIPASCWRRPSARRASGWLSRPGC